MVPSQHESISRLVRHDVKKVCLERFGLLQRDETLVDSGFHGLQSLGKSRPVDLFAHVPKAWDLRASTFSRTH